MRQLLREHLLYQPFEASGGAEGLRLAREMAPAVIVLDLLMPDVDGFAVLEQLQSNPNTRAIPVIIATSLSQTNNLRARLPAGIRILAKDCMTRESFASVLDEATAAIHAHD